MPPRGATDAQDSVDAITDALLTASRLLVTISARSIAENDETLTIAQFRTLVLLATRGPVNLATMAGLLDVQPSTTGRMVDRLVGAGLVDRRPNPQSRRELVVNLTDRPAQALVKVPWDDVAGRAWKMTDLFTNETFERSGDELRGPGIYVDLPAWGRHFLTNWR